jgi:hypothetical protein
MKYASNEHTLGPTFSEEEDGDDSDWIASKMASLGLDPNGKPYAGGFAQVSVVANTHFPCDADTHAPFSTRNTTRDMPIPGQRKTELGRKLRLR